MWGDEERKSRKRGESVVSGKKKKQLTHFCLFFFKQKTAYEIGTGDWSSDVCSSDLIAATVTQEADPIVKRLRRSLGEALVSAPGAQLLEIGRASCRERV